VIELIPVGMENTVFNIFQSAISRMQAQNIQQWDDIYPDRDIIETDIKSGSMYGYFLNEELYAVQVLDNTQSPEYSQINWKYPDNFPLVLHRLCVSPEHQNKGIAKEMILFAEKYAEKNKYKTIRFDTFTKNPVSVNLYTKLGYTNSGSVRFRKGEFYCFEKKTIHY